MLSIAKLTSSAKASSYFELDDYYSKEETLSILKETTSWHGSLKNELNLSDYIKADDFKDLLDGKIIKNDKLIQNLTQYNKEGESTRCAGTDLTFSAPKSLSILSEVLGKKELAKIHDNAVKNTLDYVESHLITTQIRKGSSSNIDSTVTLQKTNKALFATFKHNTSRNLDPQLHTHAVAINITRQDKETKYRSTEFKKIFENKMLLGSMYRSELANQLIKKGYEIEQTHRDGRFEIKNFPQDLITKFSSRRQEIEKALKNLKTNNAKVSAKITLKTRNKKVETSKSILEKEWKNAAKEFELSDFNVSPLAQEDKSISSSVAKSINSLTERESVFTKEDLLKHVLASNIEKGIVVPEVNNEINLLIDKKEMIILKDGSYTTKTEIEQELQIIKEIESVSKAHQISSKKNVDNIIKTNQEIYNQYLTLTDGQKKAFQHILTSEEQIIGIQGGAGTGKTYMLSLAKQVLKKEDYEFIALAPSSSATKLLKEDAKIETTKTLQGFLVRYEKYLNITNVTPEDLNKTQEYFSNKIIVLDEASLVSNRQMLNLLNIVKNLDVKLVLQGDIKQLSAIESGKPFHQMQKAGMETAVIDNIVRQKDGTDLKDIVESTIKDDIKYAFQKLGDNVFDLSDKISPIELPPQNLNALANEDVSEEYSHKIEGLKEISNLDLEETIVHKTCELYFSLSEEERNSTLILTPANETRQWINSAIRSKLKGRKLLEKESKAIINTLKTKPLTSVEKTVPSSYEKNDILIFNKDYKSLEISKGEELRVISREKEILCLEDKENKRIKINLSSLNPKTVEIYTKEEREILKNEMIRFTKNNKSFKFINSHTAKVINIDDKKNMITLKLDNNKQITIPEKDLKYFDYAYSSTAYSAQGKTSNNVIAVLESYRKNLTNQQTFYVEISRAKENAFLITDNKDNLIRTLENQTGEKLSAVQIKNLDKNSLQKQESTLKISTKIDKSIEKEVELRD